MKLSKKNILIVMLVLFIVAAVTNLVIGTSKNSDKKADGKSQTLTKDTAEKSCQDVAVTKTQGRKINIIDLGNYNDQFSTYGSTSTFSWNGSKDGKVVTFVCEISGTNDSPMIKSLDMNAERLQ